MSKLLAASPADTDFSNGDSPSPFTLFRIAMLLAGFAIGLQKFAEAAWVAPAGWLFIHWPLSDLLLWLPGELSAGQLAGLARGLQASYLLAPFLFAACFWRCSVPSGCTRLTYVILLAMQVLLGLAFNSLWLILVAACLSLLLPLRTAIHWLAWQIVTYLLVYLVHSYLTRGGLHLGCSLLGNSLPALNAEQRFSMHAAEIARMAAYQLIAFGVGYLGRVEQASRHSLALVHAETLAAQHLLGDSARLAERVRIARDLHDGIGHQLAAINLHLELAARQASLPVPPALSAARVLAQRLLAEVRAIVSVERRQFGSDAKP